MTPAAEPVFHTSGIVRLTRAQLIGTMAGLLLTLLLAAIDQTIVGTAEPRIIAQLSGFDRYPWVATAYLLTSTVVVPIIAKLSDIYGRRGFFLGGAVAFVTASGLCGASGTLNFLGLDGMNQLILFRGLQGLGAGMIMGLTFTIIGDIFSPLERGKYMGFFAAVFGVASIFGPTLGGFLTDHVSWRACFYVNLPVGAVAIAALYFEFPNLSPRSAQARIDWAGVLTLIGSMVPLLLALTWVTDYGWTSPRVDILLAVAAVMLAAFLHFEMKASEPLLPLTLFRNPVIGVCSVAVFVMGMGMFGVIIYLPLFMQGVLGVSATQSGSLLTPLMMGMVFSSTLSGQLNTKLKSYKTSAVTGSVLVAMGMILFARMDGSTLRWEVVRAMIIAGIGMGFLNPVYTVAVQNVAPRHQMGAATASTMFFRSIGSTLGVAIFGSLLLTNFHREFLSKIPAGTPPEALVPFSNPVMLPLIRDRLDAMFSQYPDGARLLQTLLLNVREGLLHGLEKIFFWSAVMTTAAIALHVMLKNVPLRGHTPEPPPPSH
jgi:EmrB/QacA subfamily drug resistance transporter